MLVSKICPQGLQIADLIGNGTGLTGLQGRRFANSALVVEDNRAILSQRIERRRGVESRVHIAVVYAWPAIDDKEGRAGLGVPDLIVECRARALEEFAGFELLSNCE